MELFPAIDIRDGKAVRLTQGDYDREQIYNQDPLAAAMAWVQQGARWLHVVDLDGALSGERRNIQHLSAIAQTSGVPVEYGGGIRDLDAVKQALDVGVQRVILGTAAFKDPVFLDAAVSHAPEAVVVSIDARDGMIASDGWTSATTLRATEAVAEMAARGVNTFVYTDIARDGMLTGPNIPALREICAAAAGAQVIASGGVGELSDLADLAATKLPNLEGVIVGKALYEQKFNVTEALELLDAAA